EREEQRGGGPRGWGASATRLHLQQGCGWLPPADRERKREPGPSPGTCKRVVDRRRPRARRPARAVVGKPGAPPPLLLAIAVAFVSVGLGVLLGLARTRTRVALGAVRTFALVAALATVALELLPGAAARGGLGAIAVFAVAATLPWALEKVGGRI